MDLTHLNIMKGLIGKMGWLTQRQSLIAENVAQADVPGYLPRDLKPFTFETAMNQQLAAATTNSMHIQPASTGGGSAKAMSVKSPYEIKPSGNAVSLEEQATMAATTAGDYQLITNLYSKTIGLIKTAMSSKT